MSFVGSTEQRDDHIRVPPPTGAISIWLRYHLGPIPYHPPTVRRSCVMLRETLVQFIGQNEFPCSVVDLLHQITHIGALKGRPN